jgi:hypothetical protein
MRIKEYANMLRYYRHYHGNNDFRRKIEIIKIFLLRFEPKESKLGEFIKEMTNTIRVFSQLLDEIDQINVERPEIREKVELLIYNQAD